VNYRGHVQKGVVVLDEPANLDEGIEVIVEPVIQENPISLADRFRKVIGAVTDLPPDMAANHDLHIHGTANR
jgi:hypothetical protein